MIKKILCAFFVSLLTFPVMADNWIKFKAQAVEDTINTIVAEDKRQATADEYQKQMDQTTGKISVIGIYKVCAAAGKDIRTNDGYSQCRYFINQLAEKSDFGTKSVNQANCANMFNGIWSLSKDGKEYQCVGKDGYKLVYAKSCDNAGGDCIKDFAGLKTQGPNGREFIAAWAKKKNIDLTCYIGFETRRGVTSPLGQDYIQCSAGGKSYEFEFDSLNETPGKTSMDSENKAICEFYGGKIVDTSDAANEKLYKSCDVPKAACYGDISSLASKTGHNVMYQGYCRLSREPKSKSIVELKSIDGVDNRVFYNSGGQMRADMAKVQLEEYLHNTFPNEKYIVCDPAVKPFDYGLGLDKDYILSCTVGSKQVDFLFDDLTESNKSRADTGMDAMQCIISGGMFKGESCRGPTPEECTKLDAALRAKGSTEGAKWDSDVRACILGNAMKTYKQDVATGYVVGAVVIVGGAIVTIGTGGAAVPVIVGGAEMLVTDLAINYTIDWNHRRLSKQAANRFDSFMTDASKCTDEKCALKVLEKHYATLSNVMNDLNTDDQEIIDNTMDNLLRLIQTEYVACGKNDAGQTVYADPATCAMQSSTLRVIDYVDRASEPVLIIASVIYNPGYVTRRFMKIKTVSKVAGVLDDKADDVMRVMVNNSDGTVDVLKQKQLLTDKWISNNNEVLKLMDYYNIDAIPEDPTELKKLFDKHQDLRDLFQKSDDIANELISLRRNNPSLWEPGEDVALYYDYKKVQQKFEEIDAEDAAYISELERKNEELFRTPEGVRMHTDEVYDEIYKLKKQQSMLINESLKMHGLSYDDISKVGKEEMNALEQSLRSKDSELAVFYEEMQASGRDYAKWSKAYDKYQDRLKLHSEYNDLYAKFESERKILDKQSWDMQKAIAKENPDVAKLNKQIDDLEHTYSPEYETYLNEQEYVQELLKDAKKTVGDKKNVVWWDAIPDEIKEKYVGFMDEKMVQILSEDTELAMGVKNFDVVYNDPELYSNFIGTLDKKLNEYVFDPNNAHRIKMSSYDDAGSRIGGWHSGSGGVGINRLNSMNQSLDGTIGTVKHEVLGHHIDQAMPNYGLQGELMQDYIKSTNKGFSKYSSHGNSDPDIIIAKSPILGTEFSISDASEATKKALENEGFIVYSVSDPDSYRHYRAEMTEQEAWLLTPTSNTAEKVEENFIRKHGFELPLIE